ncbi:ABC transporter permease [Candidatus Micrarchaeota archaeon]|nr:ABC transporter permease [Candidatus Micrarchaeota archaeon]
MNLGEMVNYSMDYLGHHKLRTVLTVLGIVVGISSVILLVGLVQGLKADILKQLEDFGPRTIIISPASASGGGGPGSSQFMPTKGKLFEKDYERIKRLPNIASITKVIASQATLTFKNESISGTVYGIEAGVFDDTVPVEMESGRFLESSDRAVAGLGHDIATGFEDDVQTQSSLFISGKKFKVLGLLKETGNSFAPMDSVVFIPVDDARELFNNSLLPGEISAIRLTLKEGSDVEADAEWITDQMMASHRVTNDTKDFTVITPKFINDRFNTVFDLLTLFLSAIASISLIVGGIGIMNTMFMSVLERRREIGTMKAIGASTEQIRNLFIVESAMLGFAGGILGLLAAVGIAYALIIFFNLTFVFDPLVIGGSIAFSITLGLISGTKPAIDAARIDPIEALRYE